MRERTHQRIGKRLAALPCIFVVVLLLSACNDGETKKLRSTVAELQDSVEALTKENADLTTRLADALKIQQGLEKRIAELSLTAPVLLKQVEESAKAGDAAEVQRAVNILAARFPDTVQHKKAIDTLENLRAKEKQKQVEAQRLASMGFKALKIEALRTELVTVMASTPRISRQFVFDRYDDHYHYFDSDRDHKYVVTSLLVTAGKGVTNPRLPGIALYRAEGKRLRKLGDFDLRFSAWSDYATYLGNYSDSQNDFAKIATIKFDAGVEVSDSELANRPLYLVATKDGCLERNEARFDTPPVSYSGVCSMLSNNLTLDDFSDAVSKVVLIRRVD